MYISFIVKNGSENDFIKLQSKLSKLKINKYIVFFENTVYKNDFAKTINNNSIEIYKNNNNFNYSEFIYEIICKYNGKCIFILNMTNLVISKFKNILRTNNLFSFDINDTTTNFTKQINKVNTNLIEKLFCYNYPNILLNQEFYIMDIFMIDSNALWIKKMFFELRFMSIYYITSDYEFNFTLNLLINKYIHHYVKKL